MSDALRMILAVALVSAPAAAQSDPDAGEPAPEVEPIVAESDAPSPAELLREIELPEEEDAGVPEPAAPVAVLPVEPPPLAEPESEWKLTANLAASFRLSYAGTTLFPFDAEGTTAAVHPFMTRLRVTPEIRFGGFGLVAEADAASGAIFGTPPDALVSDRQPFPGIAPVELRKLYLEFKWNSGLVRVGQQTSNWGLGLLANDGAHDAEAGDFGQKHFGNLTWRALLAARPFYGLGGAARAVEALVAGDLIVRDNFGEFSKGDRAFQAVFALRFAKDNENNLGFYAVYRNQRNAFVTDGGKATDAFILDLAGKWQFIKEAHRELKLGFELVGITGTSTQARNENADELKLSQLGFALKGKYRVGAFSVLFDGGYASGDQNAADQHLDNLRFDRDYKVGLILFDQVMAYQSGRSAMRASDPSLVGRPPEGVDLLGTAGSITGAWYLFPRVKFALADWVDVYGGPLFAFSTARLTDPYNSRLAGGVSVNPLGGHAGLFLGTEIDLGLQLRYRPIPELLLTLTGEGGVFAPGNAYRFADDTTMMPVGFGRVRLAVAFN